MTKNDRYDVSDLIEAQYQPGSRGRVLRNLQEITGKRMMDEAEAREQKRALQEKAGVFRAVQSGMDYNYGPMEEIFTGVVEKTLRWSARP
jgi:hypothetical protein